MPVYRMLSGRPVAALVLPAVLATAGCDIVTADFKHKESTEWRKTYELQPGGRVEIGNVNGKIDVEPSTGNTVEIVALKTARAGSAEGAKQALERIQIREEASPSSVKVETNIQRNHSFFNMGGAEVRYTVRVPAGAEVRFTTVNGGIELGGLTGRIRAETTNGGITARNVEGSIEASTTNGGVDVELSRLNQGGVRLECTNGGIKLRLPSDSKANISANVTNGGINTEGLSIDTTETSRRHLEGRLNGGGPTIKIEGTNGGIRIAAR